MFAQQQKRRARLRVASLMCAIFAITGAAWLSIPDRNQADQSLSAMTSTVNEAVPKPEAHNTPPAPHRAEPEAEPEPVVEQVRLPTASSSGQIANIAAEILASDELKRSKPSKGPSLRTTKTAVSSHRETTTQPAAERDGTNWKQTATISDAELEQDIGLQNEIAANHETASTEEPETAAANVADETGSFDRSDSLDEAPESLRWETITIVRGDSFAVIFERLGLGKSDWLPIVNKGKQTKMLSRIKVGDTMDIARHPDGRFAELLYPYSRTSTLHLKREADEIQIATLEQPIDYETASAHGVIDSSLFMAGQKAGMSDKLTMELAAIFGWDIDFALDIRQGDRFGLIYEELHQNGEKIGTGNILAAEFVNQGRTVRALRYTDENQLTQYYTPEGKSLKATFLRTPVDFARVSSHFNLRRRHPVLNRIRAHKGVDYAAARGTRIRAAGDGKIIHRGRKGGYGNTIIVQHGNGITTLYAHMSKYARGMKVGKRVRQAQTIGYVGSSGLATGPHLHYEFRVNGAHKNPLKVKLPNGIPLPKKMLAGFRKHGAPLLARLDEISQTQVAQRD